MSKQTLSAIRIEIERALAEDDVATAASLQAQYELLAQAGTSRLYPSAGAVADNDPADDAPSTPDEHCNMVGLSTLRSQ
jgi:hypothetical protein